MLKNMAFKKLMISSISLFIIGIIYFMPTHENYNFKTTLTYSNPEVIPIYLLDNNNYVARYNIVKKNSDDLELVDYIIKNLTISDDNHYLPNGFYALLPINTKILNKSINDGLLKINFSKDILTVDKNNEEKMIEALIYSLTEVDSIDKIMIFVEGENLNNLPNSNKRLPLVLDKKYGINKDYDIKNIKNSVKTTTYYLSKNNNIYYYVPVTSITNNDKEKIEIIIEKLKTSPTYKTNLKSFLRVQTELINYEILENSVNLSFNNHILNIGDDKISEEVKYSIGLSIRDTYNIDQTIFYVDNNLIDHLNL